MEFGSLAPVFDANPDAIIHAADEGIPIAALRRIFGTDPALLRVMLHDAVTAGRITVMPAEDWPLLVPRDHRTPTVPPHTPGGDDRDVVTKMARRLKTTKLESHILLVILRRGYATREQLHDAVEFNRGNPADATDKKIVDVVVCKLRKKLDPMGLTLHTIHAIGYEMSKAHRQKAWAMIEGDGS